MTKEEILVVLERVKSWPDDKQECAGELLLEIVESCEKLWPLTEEERADLKEALREIERGEIASEAEVAEIYRLASLVNASKRAL
jgi:hypothetical protein